MKIRVALDIKTNSNVNCTIEVVVKPFETVASVKEQVATKQLIPFPEQELVFDGKALDDEAKLAACGIRDGSSMTFNVRSSEATLAHQLAELLESRNLSVDELGLLYCYKHGVSISQALKLLAFGSNLSDFISKQKTLLVENGCVALAREDLQLQPSSAIDNTAQFSKASCSLNSQIAIAAPPGLGGSACSSGASSVEDEDEPTLDAQHYIDLHNKICSRPFNSKITQVLNALVAALSGALFLDIDHITTGGSVAKGTAICGAASAEVVLFLRNIPSFGNEAWLPSLLKAVGSMLSQEFQAAHSLESVHVAEKSVQFLVRSAVPITVDLYLSPTFESYAKTLETLAEQVPELRKSQNVSLTKERTQFVARQPSSVKVTMRLMKWWRDQQEWCRRLSRPSDELLELATIYSAIQTRPADQKIAITNVMSLLSRFDKLRVVWSNYYSKDDIWKPLLRQRPLLMDPTNPYANIADPQVFDPSELMILAATSHFFW